MSSFAVNVSSLYIGTNVNGNLSKHNACCKIRPLCDSQRKMGRAMPLLSCVAIQYVRVSASGKGMSSSESKRGFFDQKSFTDGLCGVVVKGIIGSLFFLGFVNVRQAMALPAPPSVNIQEISDKIQDNSDKINDNINDKGTGISKIEHEDTGISKFEHEDIVISKFEHEDTADIEDVNLDPEAIKSEDEALYLKLLEQNPRDVSTLQAVLLLKIRKKEYKKAVKYVEMLIDVNPNEVEWRLLEAYVYEMMGQLSKSKRLFKEILGEWPLLFKALHGLAMVMTKKHEGPVVFEMLYKASDLASRKKRVDDERNIGMLIAQMHLVHDNLDEALRKIKELRSQNPRDFRPYLLEGIIYSLQGKEKEAEDFFNIFQSLVPEDFPERGYLDDIILEAKTELSQQLDKRV
ncbi:hypothetical protein Droror1_Dr00022014 [Drosera rotundifolia]